MRSPAAAAGSATHTKAAPSHRAPLKYRRVDDRFNRLCRDRSGNILRFARQAHDVKPTAHAVAAVSQSTIIDIGVVAGYIERGIGHTIDDRAAGLRELIDRRNEVRHFPRMIRITDVGDANAGVEPGAGEQSGIGRILEVLRRRVNAEARTARTEVGAPGEVIDGHGGDRPGVLFRTGVAALTDRGS